MIKTCLQKDPEQRYQQIEDLISDLNKINKQEQTNHLFKKPIIKILMPVVLVMIILVGYFIFRPPINDDISPADDAWQHSIAVLPFADMSSDQDQEFFCDGMAEEIINALTNVGRLRVIARTSAFAFKGKNMDVRDIGKQLDVETLLEGSVRKSGERLRVTTQLVRTADGAHLWSKQYDRNLTDIFAIQEEIALVIVSQLKIKLLGNEEQRVTRRLTKNLEAYHHYLRGRHILNRRKAADIHKAITYFQKSLELDSLYIMGYVGLADAYALLPSYTNAPSEKAYTRSKEAISRALKINNQVGEAYASLGWIRMLADWDWKGAEQAFQRGMELNPGYATLNHWYGYFYMMLRKFDQALIKVQRALELDPLSPVINRVVGDVYYNSGQYDQAIPVLKKCLELEPCLPFAHLQLSGCYSRKSLFSEALKEMQKEKECRGNDYTGVDYLEGMIYTRMGEMEKARQVLTHIEGVGGKSTGVARLYFALGEKEKGYQMLEELHKEHNTWIIYINCLPDFDQVRDERRFQALLKKIGF
jgi:TolB-like protein/Flp pilus assembly protein TadD